MSNWARAHIGFGFKFLRNKNSGKYPEAIKNLLNRDPMILYAEKKGLISPPYDNVCLGPAWDTWRADSNALWTSANVTIEHGGCRDENDEYYLLVTESHLEFDWEQEVIFHPEKLAERPEWRQQLRDFCNVMGLEYFEPQYMGFVFYG